MELGLEQQAQAASSKAAGSLSTLSGVYLAYVRVYDEHTHVYEVGWIPRLMTCKTT